MYSSENGIDATGYSFELQVFEKSIRYLSMALSLFAGVLIQRNEKL